MNQLLDRKPGIFGSARTSGRESDEPSVHPATEATRRLLNVVVASVALVVTAPLMLVVAILIKLDSRGPVIFTQPRVGLDRRGSGRRRGDSRREKDLGGRIFTIYKFRTMTCTPPEQCEERWASEDDPRITRIGRLLRATRIDELPQLVNVVKGDMNIVGPRPEQPSIFAELREEVSDYPARQRVLPGITGWAQVNQGYDSTIEDVRKKVQLDLEYIGARSPGRDLIIMARTMPVMVGRKGSR